MPLNNPLLRYFQIAVGTLILVIALIAVLGGNASAALPVGQAGNTGINGGPPTATATAPCGPAWRGVISPDPPTQFNDLNGVAMLSQNNVWAIGATSTTQFGTQPLALHWDGTAWSVAAMPTLPAGSILYGIDALSPTDMWAVGAAYTETLAMHWDGSAWTQVATPSVTGQENRLAAISAVSPNDIWAVGSYCCIDFTSAQQTLILHWNGSAWAKVASPNFSIFDNYLAGVSAFASNDVWAVGKTGSPGSAGTLALHWDGTSWTPIDTPQTPIDDYYPYELDVVGGMAGNDVWAIGTYRNNSFGLTLTEHWDGSQWTIVPSPADDSQIQGIHAFAGNDVWAVGYRYISAQMETYVLHWDGSAWNVVASPNITPGTDRFNAIDGITSSDMWAVGTQGVTPQEQTLIEHYSDPCITPSPTSTGTPPTPTFIPSATSTPSCPIGWNTVTSPNSGSNSNYLADVADVSATDAWAVGYYTTTGVEQTLAMERSGDQWQIVSTPNQGTNTNNRLTSVTVVSSNDVWAVGYSVTGSLVQTLALHWDGSSWTTIATPNPGSNQDYLYGVDALSASDIWAVGTSKMNGTDYGAITLHWNGTQWSEVTNPATNYYYALSGVSIVSSNDVWAVGQVSPLDHPDTFTMHWNGTAWTIVPSPSPGQQYDDTLKDVGGLASTDVWAAGTYNTGNRNLPLALHWDGTAWSQVTVPHPSGDTFLLGMDAVASNNIWVTGYNLNGSPTLTQTVVMRWNGSGWGVQDPPSPGESESVLNSIAEVSSNEALAVGYADTGSEIDRTLIERLLAACPASTPTPTATSPASTLTPTPTNTEIGNTNTPTLTVTGTPPSATSTSIASDTPTTEATPSSTETIPPTSTACSIQFTDVLPGSTFYDFVRCMACRGIINGYPVGCETGDPCFRPNNNVTRGQLSKIVVNAAGFDEIPGAVQYQDVAPGSTFYDVIWRLSDRHIVTGYPCGGPNEPCVAPHNLPYFRPNGNATRGQISKIVSNAAGYDEPAGNQIFEDVVPGSTFYDFVQRLATHGAMSGYACGGTDEPCNPPDNRPYFRPVNVASRGQTAKIVSNTFLPDCQTPGR